MSDVMKRVLEDAIRVREQELEELRRQLRAVERGESNTTRPQRKRKATGLKEGSIPFLISRILKASGPLSSADISEKLKEQEKREVHSRFVAAALNRYVEDGRIFGKTQDGLYTLRSDAA